MEVSKIVIKSGEYDIKDKTAREKILNVENDVNRHSVDIDYLSSQSTKQSVDIENIVKNETHYGGYGRRKFIAHRGLSALAPDNTLESLWHAGKQGFWGCEIDIRETIDGVFVLAHDDELSWWSTGVGKISTSTWDYIKTLKITTHTNINGFEDVKIPSLNDAIILMQSLNMHLVIEVKKITNTLGFIQLLERYNMLNHVTIVDFNLDNVLLYRQLAPSTMLQHVSNRYPVENLQIYKENKIGLDLNIDAINKDIVDEIKFNGIELGVWTVNEMPQLKICNDLRVDYITTNWAIWQTETEKGKVLYLTFNSLVGNVPFREKYDHSMGNGYGNIRVLLSSKYLIPYAWNIPIPTIKGFEFGIHCFDIDDVFTEDFGWVGHTTGTVKITNSNSMYYRLYVKRIGDAKFTPKYIDMLENYTQ